MFEIWRRFQRRILLGSGVGSGAGFYVRLFIIKMQRTDGTLPKIGFEYWNFNVSVTACRLSLIMILLIELFQFRKCDT